MAISLVQTQLFFLAVTRILAIIIHVPVLGGRSIPNPVKVGLGVLLAIVLLPWQPLPGQPVALDAPGMPVLVYVASIARELIIGTLAGFAAVLTFGVLQITGTMIGLSSGFGAGQFLNPALEDTGAPVDQFYTMMAILFFLVTNAHHGFLLGLQQTFQVLPINGPPLGDLAVIGAVPGAVDGTSLVNFERLVSMSARLITAGVHMALPVVGTLLLTDITLGLLSRIAPQIQVFFLGLPIKIILGLLALVAALTAVTPKLSELLRSLGPGMLSLLGV
jgi:flagellar biosynthetic protein FliR